MSKGIIYILTNEAMPGLCKIGRTTRSDLQTRMNELYTTGVPFQFECVYACEFENCEAAEYALHTAFSTDRVNPKREFFKMDPFRAVALLRAFGGREVSAEVRRDLDSSTTSEEKRATEAFRARRPNMNYEEMGIPVGSRIVFSEEENIFATIADGRHVTYEGETYSLTALTRMLLKLGHDIQPGGHWTYNGRSLNDIYEETYPREG